MHIFITGTAGFIGFHLAQRLLRHGHEITGIDGLTSYYDVTLKQARRTQLQAYPRYHDVELLLEDYERIQIAFQKCIARQPIDIIIHLAAQAGVRYSLENPRAYVDSNLVGTFNVMELARRFRPKHFLFASTSSVYGANPNVPWRETDTSDYPLTLYAASKKSTEAMIHSYSHLWDLPATGFRFFTVYGPWGRPDMAFFKFTKAMLADDPIEVYNHGNMQRDFTYIDDLVEAIVRLMDQIPQIGQAVGAGDSLSPVAPFRIVNIGNGAPESLIDFISEIEKATEKKSHRRYLPMQLGDMQTTFADTNLLQNLVGYRPDTAVSVGVPKFVRWYRDYYKP